MAAESAKFIKVSFLFCSILQKFSFIIGNISLWQGIVMSK